MSDDAIKPTTETDRPNLSTEHQRSGDARRAGDTLDKGQAKAGEPDKAEIARRARLLGDE